MSKRKFKIHLSDLPVFILVGLLLYWLSSCGGESSERVIFSSNKSKQQKINTLSDKEFDELCQETEQYLTRILSKERLCLFEGHASETLRAKMREEQALVSNCTANTSRCLEERLSPNLSEFKCLLNKQGAQNCAATFEELDACLNENFSILESFFSSLTCAFVGDPSIGENGKKLLTSIPENLACRMLKNKCPALLQALSN
ncbi:MAG: hypothetical protein GYA55_04125 [SAR324 cluster bacterium]|uniref:Uncharacterized protein n=1 Tax=SAR324 cluster bacterium TaxID=2024889 RepID=A0A7X9FQ85_9DELT|nr:hypothetical protein [SAR324 cluster bacterium]